MTDAAEPSASPVDSEREWLARAATLARRGWGRVRPNPMVGCVLVKDGVMVGEGWHEEFGGPHAEVNALRVAGEGARDATAYVTLEPCNHYGKTPPCTDALLDAGVSRVVFGAPDPGAEAAGSRRRLSNAGVEVSGPSSDPALGRDVGPAFFHTTDHGRTYLAVKLAVSRDGRIAAGVGERTALTGGGGEPGGAPPQEWVRRHSGGCGDRLRGRPPPHRSSRCRAAGDTHPCRRRLQMPDLARGPAPADRH